MKQLAAEARQRVTIRKPGTQEVRTMEFVPAWVHGFLIDFFVIAFRIEHGRPGR
jgi:hypothetical protein